ncbi:RNA 2',3'-cyclic phosphodiesterase [Candidatus Parcubacteria bacterium]|nr:RNA 2',3'-cyclic phosphodiesterase [Candidatus Parcubacteria bacterium]
MKRIFIAINLPEKIKKELLSEQEKWPELPIKWVKPDNLHITLIFLGNINDQEILEIDKTVKGITARHQPFSINLNRICYAPPKKIPPRMVWAEGEKVKELADLKQDLEKSLIDSGINFTPENRDFRPHITLGRIKTWEWSRIEPEERPEIDEEISLNFPVNSIEMMESQLKRGGAEYAILESVKL